jgi:multidrug transporter EmrE-like cation transporter
MPKTLVYLIFLLSVATTIIGQLFLKKATLDQRFTFDPSNLLSTILSLALNPYLIAWILSSGISAALWIVVVSRFELSFAFPVSTTLTFILILIFSWWLFGEAMSLSRWIGIGLMCVGIFLTYQSKSF